MTRTPSNSTAHARHGEASPRRPFDGAQTLKLLLTSTSALGAMFGAAAAQELPQGGVVTTGDASIRAGAGAVTIDQSSQNAIINWQSFDIGAGNSVTFNQPGAQAATLNRVLGSTPSILSGSLFAPGSVFLVNPNGIGISSSGRINVGTFAASTHDISDENFLAGRFTFEGEGGVVTNRGRINARNVALVGGAVRNEGVVVAELGQVAYAAGDLITIDFGGDSLISIGLPASELKGATDVFGTPLDALVSAGGVTRAGGGRVTIRAGAAEGIALAAVRVDGTLRARSVTQTSNGGVVLGGDVSVDGGDGLVLVSGAIDVSSAAGAGGGVEIAGGYVGFGGAIDASGRTGGSVRLDASTDLSLAGVVDASGAVHGGAISYEAGRALIENASSRADASGGAGAGGTIGVRTGGSIVSSGAYDASGVTGGQIDVTAPSTMLLSAHLDASGADAGGMVRVGGAFQGGRDARTERADFAAFEGRFGDVGALANALTTFVNDGTVIDVSATSGAGGSAIVWSGQATTMLGRVDARGASGGNVEISSAGLLRQTDLAGVNAGQGGTVLLDPANILIGDYAAASGWTYAAIIGVTAAPSPGVDAYVPPDVSGGESFGYSVSLNAAGDRLAVGGPNDAGFGDGTGGAGAVRLFTFTDGDFNGAALAGTVGLNYVGAGNVSVVLGAQDNFGQSLALNAAGDRLAVGATGDDGFGNLVNNAGATYLVSFTDGSFGGGSLAGTIGAGYTGGNNVNVSTLAVNDAFGRSVSLNGAGDRLAVGIQRDAGFDNTGVQLGAVQLFTFIDANFAGGALAATIGRGYVGPNDYDIALENSDFFGVSVSLNAVGDRLAIGTAGDDGVGNAVQNAGAVRLFEFATPNFTGVSLSGTMGVGYVGAGDVNLADLSSDDEFGAAVSLTALGDRIAVGVRRDDGFGNLVSNSGAVRLYRFADTSFNGALHELTIGQGYVGPSDINMSFLPVNATFGHTVALNGAGDRLVVGAELQNLSNAVWLFTSEPDATGGYLFSDNPDGTSLISRTALAATLANGSNVLLQANNDITLEGDLIVDGPGVGGNLDLTAGRSIDLGDNSIVTDGGNLALLANATVADGVIDAHRAAGAAQIVMGASGSIDAGAGDVSITLSDGAGLTNSTSGDITLASITAASINVRNAGATAGSDVAIHSAASLTTTDAGLALTVAADHGTFTNNGVLAPLSGGRFAVWADSPLLTLEGALGYTKRYGVADFSAFTSLAAGATDDLFAYRLAPILTVTANGDARIYGEADPGFTFGTSGLIDGDTEFDALTGALTRVSGENVGFYNILQGTLAATEFGYTISYVGADLEITARPIIVTANGDTRIYGEADPAFTYAIGGMGLAFSDAFTGDLSRDSGENVGLYNITEGTLALNANYALTYNGAQLEITARPISVTADGQARIYGESDPALTYAIGGMGLAFSDAFTGALTRDAGETVGLYDITQGTLALNANYTLSYTGAQLDITARPIIVTASGQARIYGEADPPLTYAIGGMGLAFSDAFSGGLARDAGETAGLYDITQGTLALDANYALSYNGAQFEITPRPISVTADGQTRIYGEADPALTYAIGGMGLAFSDAFSGALTRDAGENVGLYDITQGTLALNSNYALTYNGDQLQITPRAITVTANGQARIYGEADPALTYAIGGMGLTFSDAFSGGLARDAGENVGVYDIIQGSLALNANYALTFNGTQFEITPRPITVTANGQSRIYGEADPSLTYAVGGMGLAFSDAFTGALARDAGENVGVYAINQGTLALGSNYAVAYNGAQLQITPRAITVTANDVSRIYGEIDPALAYGVGGMGLAFSDAFTGALDRDAGENVGAYGINQGTLALNSNYTLTFNGAQFEITPRPISVTANGQSRIYGNADPAFTYVIGGMGLAFGDALTGGLSRAGGENLGMYAIGQGTLALTSNYALTFNGANLQITPRPITVTADDISRMFNHADPALTWAITQGNLVFADVLGGGLARAPGELPGLYPIVQGTLGNSNYAITYLPGVFQIEGQGDGGASTNDVAGGPDARTISTVRGIGLAEGDASGEVCPDEDAGVCVIP